jgi:uncharacterized membrane protein YGL010W
VQTLEQCLSAYGPYHRDARNKLTHAVGVPMLIVSILIVLPSWMGVAVVGAAAVYYWLFDWLLGAVLSAVFVGLFAISEAFNNSLGWAAILFAVGWAFQLLGHFYEGRKPALTDNLWQILNAPVYLGAELLFLFGWKHDLRSRLAVPNQPLH